MSGQHQPERTNEMGLADHERSFGEWADNQRTSAQMANSAAEEARLAAGDGQLDPLDGRMEAECECCKRRRETLRYAGGRYCQPCIDWNEEMMEADEHEAEDSPIG